MLTYTSTYDLPDKPIINWKYFKLNMPVIYQTFEIFPLKLLGPCGYNFCLALRGVAEIETDSCSLSSAQGKI